VQASFLGVARRLFGRGVIRSATVGATVPAVVALGLVAWLGLAAEPAAAEQPFGIIGGDNRVVIEADDRRWHAVGRLNRETGGFCTAVLIGPKEALTAAHCLWDQLRRRWVDPQSLHFVPGYRRGTYLGHARVARYRLAEGITIDEQGHPLRLLDDWAVLELSLDLVAGAGIEPMALAEGRDRSILAGRAIASGGYSRDRPHLPVKVQPCRALGVIESGRLLLHDCDSRAGSSGSPIVIEEGGRFVVIGIQSAVVSAGGETLALAVLMQRAKPSTLLLSQ
jgi:protease YdgD